MHLIICNIRNLNVIKAAAVAVVTKDWIAFPSYASRNEVLGEGLLVMVGFLIFFHDMTSIVLKAFAMMLFVINRGI